MWNLQTHFANTNDVLKDDNEDLHKWNVYFVPAKTKYKLFINELHLTENKNQDP